MEMSLALAARSVEIVLGLSLIIQTVEFLNLREPLSDRGIWTYAIARDDLAHASRIVQQIFSFLARDNVWLLHLVMRLMAAIALVINGASLPLIAFLFLGTIVILIRWRGAFNGGSDFMTIVVLSGVLIACLLTTLGEEELGWRAGLIYIAIHAASSYFISGSIKLLNPEWRSGEALALFLDGGIYGPLSRLSLYWFRPVAKLCSWAFILWECLIPLAFLDVQLAAGYCFVAGVFHLLVFWYFGLNRFVFAWMASFPAIIYVASRLT